MVEPSQAGTAAVTGVVLDDTTSAPIVGASVMLRPTAGGPGTPYTTTSDGAFAFTNIPAVAYPGTTYNLTVSAAGYGSVSVTADPYVDGESYEQTITMNGAIQTDDVSQGTAQGDQSTAAANGALPPYASFRRTPPTIVVGNFDRNDKCQSTTGVLESTKRWPWKFYVLHVAASEIDSEWQDGAFRANFAAEQNYAWYYAERPEGDTYNIGDTTADQCFRADRKVPASWRKLLSGSDASTTPLMNRVATSSGDIQKTYYNAGSYACNDKPQDGNVLSQRGTLYREQNSDCGSANWQSQLNYYYTGTIKAITSPPAPNTSFSRPTNAVKLNFPSQVSDGNSHTSNVGWRYEVDRCTRSNPVNPCTWVIIYDAGWNSSKGTVPTSYAYNVTSCTIYRALASNPAGKSPYASFNNGNDICPG